MPRGTHASNEDRLAQLNDAFDRVSKRREARRLKYIDADAKDVEREREFRTEIVRLQVTASHAADLDAKIAEELAKLDAAPELTSSNADRDDDVPSFYNEADREASQYEASQGH